MWNAISLVQDLNSCRRVHFLHIYVIKYESRVSGAIQGKSNTLPYTSVLQLLKIKPSGSLDYGRPTNLYIYTLKWIGPIYFKLFAFLSLDQQKKKKRKTSYIYIYIYIYIYTAPLKNNT